MKTICQILTAVVLCVIGSTPSQAATTFVASLSGNIYNPPRASGASGFGTVVLDDSQTSITVSLSAFNLSSAPTLAGIFGPGNINFGAPLFLQIFMVQSSGSNYQGNAFTSVDQNFVSSLYSGQYVFNISTANFPAGIVGGTIALTSDFGQVAPKGFDTAGGGIGGPPAGVPEPGSVALTAFGALSLAIGRVLRRRG